GCAWTVFNSNAWITVTSPANNTNSGFVSFTVSSNITGLARSGVVTIANQPFTVNQDPAPCAYAISTNNASYPFGGGAGQVNVSTLLGCPWGVSNSNNWITISAGGAGGTNSGTVSYTVASNITGLARSGVVTIANLALSLTQDAAPCTYALSTNSAKY